jgi:hypothetical protein
LFQILKRKKSIIEKIECKISIFVCIVRSTVAKTSRRSSFFKNEVFSSFDSTKGVPASSKPSHIVRAVAIQNEYPLQLSLAI